MKKSCDDRDIRSMGHITKKSKVSKYFKGHLPPSLSNDLDTISGNYLLDYNESVLCSTAVDDCSSKKYPKHFDKSKLNVTNSDSVSIVSNCVLIKEEHGLESDGFSTSLDVNHDCAISYSYAESVRSSSPCTCNCQFCLDNQLYFSAEYLRETTSITNSENPEVRFKTVTNCPFNQSQSDETRQFDMRYPELCCCAKRQINSVPVRETSLNLSDMVLLLEQRLSAELLKLDYSAPVSHIYNPLEYAIDPHKKFLNRYCTDYKKVLFLGMNPGPYGMAQTGVPFGEVSMVRDWLKICGHVAQPKPEHPKRPILGFNCKRKEVSGARFWKLFEDISESPETFFRNCFVHNMCPLLFMSIAGKNLTPPDLPLNLRRALNWACDESLCNLVKLLRIEVIVGVGRYASDRAKIALTAGNIQNVSVVNIMHPSPANPATNKGWNGIVTNQLTDLGLLPYVSSVERK